MEGIIGGTEEHTKGGAGKQHDNRRQHHGCKFGCDVMECPHGVMWWRSSARSGYGETSPSIEGSMGGDGSLMVGYSRLVEGLATDAYCPRRDFLQHISCRPWLHGTTVCYGFSYDAPCRGIFTSGGLHRMSSHLVADGACWLVRYFGSLRSGLLGCSEPDT